MSGLGWLRGWGGGLRNENNGEKRGLTSAGLWKKNGETFLLIARREVEVGKVFLGGEREEVD